MKHYEPKETTAHIYTLRIARKSIKPKITKASY
jgi:hypothetical protein